MPQFRFSRLARRDLDRIAKFISHNNPKAAQRLVEEFRAKLAMLSRQPLLGDAAPEQGENLRCFPVGNYVIYYVPIPGGIRAVRILHGARDQSIAFESDE
jgi:toxin ParE1/3/4